MENGEDMFFAYCGWDKEIAFVTAPAKVAGTFSIESDIDHCYRRIEKGWLPFGCHGWSKTINFDRWEQHIRAAGYCLDEITSQKLRKIGKKARKDAYTYGIAHYLIERMSYKDDQKLKKRIAADFSWMDDAIVWGNGRIGGRVEKLFHFLGFRINKIFDKAADVQPAIEDGDRVVKPDSAMIQSRRHKILVTPQKYYDEISAALRAQGLKEDEDFFDYKKIARRIAAVIAEEWYQGRRFAWL